MKRGSARTHGRIPSLSIINTPEASVNERPRTKGINAAEPTERVTTMTSWVSWELGMKRLQATPAQTHTHTHPVSSWTTDATMGIRERGRRGIGVGLQELKESGCVWNFGSCLSPHIPHFSRNNKLCHSRYNGLLLDTLHHKKPQTRVKHAVTP